MVALYLKKLRFYDFLEMTLKYSKGHLTFLVFLYHKCPLRLGEDNTSILENVCFEEDRDVIVPQFSLILCHSFERSVIIIIH